MTNQITFVYWTSLRMSSAMIAVLTLAFLALLASLIASRWELQSSGTNGNVLDRYGIILSNRRRPKAVRNLLILLSANPLYFERF